MIPDIIYRLAAVWLDAKSILNCMATSKQFRTVLLKMKHQAVLYHLPGMLKSPILQCFPNRVLRLRGQGCAFEHSEARLCIEGLNRDKMSYISNTVVEQLRTSDLLLYNSTRLLAAWRWNKAAEAHVNDCMTHLARADTAVLLGIENTLRSLSARSCGLVFHPVPIMLHTLHLDDVTLMRSTAITFSSLPFTLKELFIRKMFVEMDDATHLVLIRKLTLDTITKFGQTHAHNVNALLLPVNIEELRLKNLNIDFPQPDVLPQLLTLSVSNILGKFHPLFLTRNLDALHISCLSRCSNWFGSDDLLHLGSNSRQLRLELDPISRNTIRGQMSRVSVLILDRCDMQIEINNTSFPALRRLCVNYPTSPQDLSLLVNRYPSLEVCHTEYD